MGNAGAAAFGRSGSAVDGRGFSTKKAAKAQSPAAGTSQIARLMVVFLTLEGLR